MKIELHEISIQEIVQCNKHLPIPKCQGYIDKEEEGVYGMAGRLNIRPEYQREFIYGDKLRNAVIYSIQKGWTLNLLQFVENKDGTLEVLDGQQRLISIGQYVSGKFSIEGMSFHNLREDQQDQILNYELLVCFCKGTESEILEWFKIVNIAGKKLSDQEGRNAIYNGPWVSDARRYFSKRGCSAYKIANRLLKGSTIRQDYLETAIKWINHGDIEEYMSKHQHDDNAEPLWKYFNDIIEWTKKLFPEKNYRKKMKGVPFGPLYNKYSNKEYAPNEIEEEVSSLMQNRDVTKKSGIYEYIFDRDENHLSIRVFPDEDKIEAYELQGGECAICREHFEIDEMDADHITPWSKGGKTVPDNCQVLCRHCNQIKSSK